MNPGYSSEIKKIGIVGGGKVGQQLFTLFSQSQLSKVEYVVDINPGAPALALAKQSGVRTFTHLETALSVPVDFILEVTGNPKVLETINRVSDRTRTSLITHDMAYIILTVIAENNRKVKDEVVSEIRRVKDQITHSLHGVDDLAKSIEDITAEMNILSINARIEAARFGEQGKTFAVVASEMGVSAERVKEITHQIEQINLAIKNTSNQLDDSLARLQ